MRGLVLFVLLAPVVSLPSIVEGAHLCNRSDVQGAAGRFSVGLEYDRVFHRSAEWKEGSFAANVGDSSFSEPLIGPEDTVTDEKSESNRVLLKAVLGLHSNVDIYLRVGVADAWHEHKHESPSQPVERSAFDGDFGLAWGVGARAKLLQGAGGFRVLVEAQYLTYTMNGRSESNDAELAEVIREEIIARGYTNVSVACDSRGEVQEWHLALYVSRRFGNVAFCGGADYSDVELKSETNASGIASRYPYSIQWEESINADNRFGVFFGTEIKLTSNQCGAYIEGRFLSELAGAVGTYFRL